jgi:hypothetical protein
VTEKPEEVPRAGREAFWTLVVGLPAAFSVLRLWVESGGELQTTLLLVSNFGPLNLGAALFATVTRPVTIVLVALFAVGGVLRAAVSSAPEGSRLRQHPPLVARVSAATPGWFVVVTFVLALITWEILYLPLLVPAAVAAVHIPPWRMHDLWPVAVGLWVAALALYGWLVWPAVRDAWSGDERVVAALLVLPPLVAFGVAGPLPDWFARVFAIAADVAIIIMIGVVGFSAAKAPILPLVVTEVSTAEGPEFIRGYVVTADEVHTVILQEGGGVRYIPNGDIKGRVLCSTPQELPTFDTRVRDYHVEDSLLSASGRHVRPHMRIDPLCRIAVPNLPTPQDSSPGPSPSVAPSAPATPPPRPLPPHRPPPASRQLTNN